MPITIRPSMSPENELDLTKALTAAVAHELWARCGGNEVVNWLEAERFVATLRRVEPRPRTSGRQAQDHRSMRTRSPRRPEMDRANGPIPYL
jgi:hypothetical protein